MGGIATWMWVSHGLTLTESVDVWEFYYPVLNTSGVKTAKIAPHDGALDVLLLGASTIEHGWGNVAELLQTDLERQFRKRVRIYNLAMIAHTSRDSVLKLRHLQHKPFDVILVYDGINDCRMNCCPTEVYRPDYSHCAWYAGFEERLAAGKISLPVVLGNQVRQRIGLGEPDDQWRAEGRTLKTPAAFRENIAEIIQIARQQGSLVVLQSFATHLPRNYTDELFRAGQLDYPPFEQSRQACPVQMWGTPEGVRNGVAAHNQILRELAAANLQDVVFVDQAREIPADGRHFIDVCHFTPQGCRSFVDNLLPRLVQHLQTRGF